MWTSSMALWRISGGDGWSVCVCVCVAGAGTGREGLPYHGDILVLDLLEREDVTYVDSTVKQIDLSPPDLYFLYFCVLMLRLYASGLTHLTMAVHVPFIKDHGTYTALSVCVIEKERECKKGKNTAGFDEPLVCINSAFSAAVMKSKFNFKAQCG